ncbi:MAG: phenylalanine--tRNA ligase subunit alpha [Candidatus Caenarcaniphilales bacterium]|nr:phenylalanine--tRNA ligase subunit alpha [Candidatus Caenarcaniphilales bacterium]
MQTINLDDLKNELEKISQVAKDDFNENLTLKNSNQIKAKYLGNKSQITSFKRYMKDLNPEDKPALGKIINQTQAQIEEIFKTKLEELKLKDLQQKLDSEKIDVSLPSQNSKSGFIHPLDQVTQEISQIFKELGFSLVDGPELENTYYNFTALNTEEDHPARDEQDTFYTELSNEILLRSHTSSIQIRAMEKLQPPFRIIGHGRVYRNEEVNARKMPFFHQLEIMMVDENVNFGHMKWFLNEFLSRFFGKNIPTRLRPDYFPFTEPSAELDAECVFCKGKGCNTCGGKGWLELMGCGMIDPNVLEMAGINSNKYSGFAAGLGLERFTMLKHKINDIRLLFSGDQRLYS